MKLRLAAEVEDKIDTSDFIGDFDLILYTIKEKLSKEEYKKFADRLLITILESKED
jgi:hypothetical protein